MGSERSGLELRLRIERMIDETLECFVAPAVRAELMEGARQASAGGQLPADAAALHEFVRGPFHRVLASRLGPDLAATVLRQFEASTSTLPPPDSARQRCRAARSCRGSSRSLSPPPRATRTPVPGGRRTSSSPPRRTHTPGPSRAAGIPIGRVRPQTERSGSALRAGDSPPGLSTDAARAPAEQSGDWPGAEDEVADSTVRRSCQLPLVLVVSRDGSALAALRALLDPRAAVERVTSLFGLLHQIEAAGGARCVVVLDCRQPPVRPAALAALADELPDSVRTILWGATVELEQSLRDVSTAAARWSCLSSEWPRQLAAHCARLVG